MMSVPNIISIIRIILVPVFCVAYFTPGIRYIAFAALIISGISDILDGYIARRFNQITDLGKVLDPVADKLFNISTILCFCIDRIVGFWLLALVAAKELFMLFGGVVFYKKTHAVIASKWYGKLASCLFFAAFVLSFVEAPDRHAYGIFINCLFAFAMAVSLFAMANYSANAVRINNLKKRKKESPEPELEDKAV